MLRLFEPIETAGADLLERPRRLLRGSHPGTPTPSDAAMGVALSLATGHPEQMEVQMSESKTKGSGLSVLDTALIVAAVIGAIFVVLWIAHAVLGLVLLAFKIAILVVIVAVVVRLVHAFSRRGD